MEGQHGQDGQNIIFTDGEYINQIAACKDVSYLEKDWPIPGVISLGWNGRSSVRCVKDLQLITSCASVPSVAVSCGYGCGCEWEWHQMCLELIFSAFNILYCELDLGNERPTSCLPLCSAWTSICWVRPLEWRVLRSQSAAVYWMRYFTYWNNGASNAAVRDYY